MVDIANTTSMHAAPTQAKEDGTQSIRRAIATLRILAMARETGFGLTEIARLTGLSHPTSHRILTALIDEGLVEQRPGARRYRLGEQIRFLALSRSSRSPLLAVAEQALADAATHLGDTMFFTQRTGLDTICLARRLGTFPIQVASLNVGDRRPLGVSSAGIVVLANLPEQEVQQILLRNAPRLTAAGTNLTQIHGWVRDARRQGYAIRDRGIVPGTRAISVVVRDSSGQPFAAITAAGLVKRMPAARHPGMVESLQACARTIETALSLQT